ncbi:hypothetical protein PHLCEN_2v2884 [Hermanssonia centrifuga]|uniref:Uncharacterized protein n=1 Tax=Hermanssonia centrifuga TaxID=98765 RepID=A0A2R6RI76_9APHY|nr:hypothetical protein PHLCEN_2v2884 [Hermanssonia centrifuga]
MRTVTPNETGGNTQPLSRRREGRKEEECLERTGIALVADDRKKSWANVQGWHSGAFLHRWAART